MDGDSRAWCILVLAGIMEMVWAIAMDYSEGFTNMLFGTIVVVFLIISMAVINILQELSDEDFLNMDLLSDSPL